MFGFGILLGIIWEDLGGTLGGISGGFGGAVFRRFWAQFGGISVSLGDVRWIACFDRYFCLSAFFPCNMIRKD